LLLLPAPAARALSLQHIGTYNDPLYVTSGPSNPDRIFIAERSGVIRVTEGGSTGVFADLSGVVNSTTDQQGLMSIAFPPDFDQSGLFYVFYSGHDGAPRPANLHVGELRVIGGTADPASLRDVITIPHGDGVGHNGGQIQFGPDGLLYISTGDGQCCDDPLDNGQDLNSLLGKILRIDPHPSGGSSYSVPPSNPFVGVAGSRGEIWSYGLRNPWRFSFDRATGAMLVADVGYQTYEEVDFEPASAGLGRGDNFGWDCREGMHELEPAGCPVSGFTDPIFEYTHSGAGNCTGSITGGYVVRDASLGDLAGRYVYIDFCVGGQLRSLVPGLPAATGDRPEPVSFVHPVSFGEDSCGRIYVVEWGGEVYRLQGAAPAVCQLSRAAVKCQGKNATIVGTAGADALRGTPRADVIVGLAGRDRIAAGAGRDRVCAGTGSDRASGGGGNDRLNGEAGGDRLFGGRGRDRLTGGAGRDRLIGGPSLDRLAGGSGRDFTTQGS
jgi:Glucose / Sorbosone dehydrogenase/RTX calcium-binding nonapeptide repeat (4 copies)